MQHDRYLDSISRNALIWAFTRGNKGGVGKSTISAAILEKIVHGSSAVALTRVRHTNKLENKT